MVIVAPMEPLNISGSVLVEFWRPSSVFKCSMSHEVDTEQYGQLSFESLIFSIIEEAAMNIAYLLPGGDSRLDRVDAGVTIMRTWNVNIVTKDGKLYNPATGQVFK